MRLGNTLRMHKVLASEGPVEIARRQKASRSRAGTGRHGDPICVRTRVVLLQLGLTSGASFLAQKLGPIIPRLDLTVMLSTWGLPTPCR